jgi:hypothetical protein
MTIYPRPRARPDFVYRRFNVGRVLVLNTFLGGPTTRTESARLDTRMSIHPEGKS